MIFAYSSVFLLGSFFLKGSGFPATLKIPISPGSKFRRLALFPLPLSPRINTGIPISHSSLSNTTRSAAFKMNMLPICVIESVLSLYTSTNALYASVLIQICARLLLVYFLVLAGIWILPSFLSIVFLLQRAKFPAFFKWIYQPFLCDAAAIPLKIFLISTKQLAILACRLSLREMYQHLQA
ncbi:MAG: hypothetical protein ACOYIE_09595, partial [Agathobaculum sp.]|uniref:hypothetical protein n=1 Tax=Agathobaculum sp. TaxID=2048138 RepID=UPI003D8BE7DC